MKNILCAASVLTLLIVHTGTAHADRPIHSSGHIGIGLGAGTIANGLSGKYFLSQKLAIQANLGSFGGGGASNRYSEFSGFAVSADVLLEQPALWQHRILDINWSIGLGGGLGSVSDTFGLAAAGVAGLEFNFNVIPIDIVLEYRPTLVISPDVDFELVDFTGHIRFYF